MKLKKSHCPKCGRPATSIWELVAVRRSIVLSDHGDHEYDEHGDEEFPDWDTSEIDEDEHGKSLVRCDANHDWKTRIA